MNKIKLGIIGAGNMARLHLAAIRMAGCFETVGITSRTAAKAQALADEFGIQAFYPDHLSLVKQAKPEALMVLVSVEQMSSVAAAVIPYGLPLFLEKPAGLFPAETLRLARLAAKYATLSMVGYNRRYYSVFHKGIEIIKKHGRLLGVAVEGHERMWLVREGGKYPKAVFNNWIYANSTHTIDLLRFFGGEIKTLKAFRFSAKGEPLGDQFSAAVAFTSGAIGSYISNWYSPGGWKVTLYGDGVTVEFKPLETGRWINKKFETSEILPDSVDKNSKPGLVRQIEAFAGMAKDKKLYWPALDLAGAYRTMRLAQRIAG